MIRLSRRYNLCHFISTHKPDIVLINETKLNLKHKLFFENYEMIRRDGSNSIRGGGTAILVRNDIKYIEYKSKIINRLKLLECCIITIPLPSSKILYVISAYYPSGNNNEFFRDEIHQLFSTLNLQNPNNYYVIAGDLNSKHSDW